MRIAITRAVSPRIAAAELTFRGRQPIDPKRAEEQHAAYERWLEGQGCRVVRAEAAPQHPDGVFVEDAAVVVDELAVITRPGVPSRRGEGEGLSRALQRYRAVRSLEEPATLDGGDVLRLGHTLYVGRSRRTNDRGISQLRELVVPLGYTVIPITVRGCLHLKSAATALADGVVLFSPEHIDEREFKDVDLVEVDPSEPEAANVVRVGDRLLASASYPRTCQRLTDRGFAVETIEYDELEKAEAGLTCCSIIFDA